MAVIPRNVSNLVLTGGEQLAQMIGPTVPTAIPELSPRAGEAVIIRSIVATNTDVTSVRFSIYHDRDGSLATPSEVILSSVLLAATGTREPTTRINFDILIAQPTETISITSNTADVINVTFYGTRLQT